MKNIIVLVAAMLSLSVSAQKDKRATSILDEMSKQFSNMKSMSASFSYDVDNGQKKITETYNGDVTVKGMKFRLKMAGQEIFANGKEMFTYVKEANEVNVTDFDPNSKSNLDLTKIYTIYKKGYKYVFVEEVKEGSNFYEVVELSPENANADITKVQIRVNKKDKTVKSWKIWHKNGKKEMFRVNKFTPNPPADDSIFTFDKKKYPGVEVVDLR